MTHQEKRVIEAAMKWYHIGNMYSFEALFSRNELRQAVRAYLTSMKRVKAMAKELAKDDKALRKMASAYLTKRKKKRQD